jgi:hypothetical protein
MKKFFLSVQLVALLLSGSLMITNLAHALFIISMEDVWMFEVACHASRVDFYAASGSLLARADSGKLMSASGSREGDIRDCEKIYDRSGSLLARRDANGRYYLASGSLLGRIEDGRFYSASGSLVLRLDKDAVYDASGRLLARFNIR